jgi:hypothetical protein
MLNYVHKQLILNKISNYVIVTFINLSMNAIKKINAYVKSSNMEITEALIDNYVS